MNFRAESYREGVRAIISETLEQVTGTRAESPGVVERVKELETLAHEYAGESDKTNERYFDGLMELLRELLRVSGEFLEDSPAREILDGTTQSRAVWDSVVRRLTGESSRDSPGASAGGASAGGASASGEAPEAPAPGEPDAEDLPPQRQKTRAMIYAVIAKEPRIAGDVNVHRQMAREIETGCYNETIRRCQQSRETHSRSWDPTAHMFIAIYSARVASVCANIDPDSLIKKKGDFDPRWMLDQLASGLVAPEEVGKMEEKDLCPQANEPIRDLIQRRIGTKVELKASTLFVCPNCKARRSTWRQVQIAAADEPATNKCTCLECGTEFEGRQ